MVAICDAKQRLLYASAHQPGSVHDSRVFINSTFGQVMLETPHKLFPGRSYLFGDSADKLLPTLMKAYVNPRNEAEREWNRSFRSVRTIIEHTFGKLKARFQTLRYVSQFGTSLCHHHFLLRSAQSMPTLER
eukprot:Pompholyxophrys_sp_v1_NODE_259_length_959_cov_1.660398.p1 type:complete len:132 gc:universal NODE_259_length_959_cov_1.660398:553-948(+)